MANIRTAIATRRRPRPLQGDGWIRSQQALEAIHTVFNVHGAGSFAEKTGYSCTGVMPTPWQGIPDSTLSWSRGLWHSHCWRSRSGSP